MLADQIPCNARNCFPGQVFNSRTQKINLYESALSGKRGAGHAH